MEALHYPLLCFDLPDKSILGILVGTNFEVVDKDVKSVKSTLSDHLSRHYKKYDEFPNVRLTESRIKTIHVKIRPTYKEEAGSFPLAHSIKVPVVLVYGPNNLGSYECHVPVLNDRFYYYNPKDLVSLATHFAANILNRYQPDQINKLLLYKTPHLAEVILRINYLRDYDKQPIFVDKFPVLSRLADRYPRSKSVKKNTSAFPEAAWEMESYVDLVIEKLIGQKTNVLVVGNSGVGKSSILRQAIKKAFSSLRKSKLDKTFWQILSQRITASAKYLGEWQESVEELVEDLQSANGILWVVDFIRLLQVGGEGAEDSVASFLISFLQQGKIQMVGEATPQELESMKKFLPGFIDNFQLIQVEELTEKKVFNILNKIKEYSSKNLKIAMDDDAISLSYRLLLRYFPYESFPGKAIKFLALCLNEARLNRQASITKTTVIDTFVKQSGMPELFLRDDILLDADALTKFFTNRIIGQSVAIDKITQVIKIFKAGLNNPKKPISTMLFAGPTGVGKTASAKALADYFFGEGQKKNPLVRIDMSEFQYPSQIHRFIGVGKEVGKLVQEIRERPFSVLLLDEVEKADPAIFDTLLSVLDEGVQVDSFGRVTNFRNTIIIMTTNLGASNRPSIGFGQGGSDPYDSAINNFFRPEFINRIDEIVLFQPLDADHIKEITRKELIALSEREGFVKRNLNLIFDESLIDHLGNTGFDARYGARPLQRSIEDFVVAPLAKWLLANRDVSSTDLLLKFEDQLEIIQE